MLKWQKVENYHFAWMRVQPLLQKVSGLVTHPDFETKRSRHQKIKTGVSVPPTPVLNFTFEKCEYVRPWGLNKTLNLANIDRQH